MSSAHIVVPFRGSFFNLDFNEAQELQRVISEKLDAAEASQDCSIVPPKVVDGFITKAAVYEFFAQLYPSEKDLPFHAGRLYGVLVNNVSWTALPLKLRCALCKELNVKTRPCIGKYNSHSSLFIDVVYAEIEVESLRELSFEQFLLLRSVGPVMARDFASLRAQL